MSKPLDFGKVTQSIVLAVVLATSSLSPRPVRVLLFFVAVCAQLLVSYAVALGDGQISCCAHIHLFRSRHFSLELGVGCVANIARALFSGAMPCGCAYNKCNQNTNGYAFF